MITIFTDGAARGNPGPGGWAAIIAHQDSVVEIGGTPQGDTTNNKMELTAAIEALQSVGYDEPITLYTDSEYLKKGITEWVISWQKNNWKTSQKKPVENQELWWALIEASKDKQIEWKVIRGHAGIPGNERCDVIATAFADAERIDLYNGPRDGYTVSLKA